MNSVEVLLAAKELLNDPKCWTKGTVARNANGGAVAPNNTDAVCWCAVGALAKICKYPFNPTLYETVIYAFENVSSRQNGIGYWNDDKDRTHEEVLNAFDRAIFEESKRIKNETAV